MIDVLIPTCRSMDEIRPMLAEMESTRLRTGRVIASCRIGSASCNRNICLDQSNSPIAIMLDDDIRGFYPGWDADLMEPLIDESVYVVSARLMTADGRVGQTCSRCYDLEPKKIEIQPGSCCVLPTAAIAFRNVGIRFDEGFLGSGFEDGDWCFEFRKQFPSCKFIQSNKCRLIHLNEMKAQREHWVHNREYFHRKWKQQPTSA